MEGVRYCAAQTRHGRWWYAWSANGVLASAHGWMSEHDFLDRLATLGAEAPERSTADRIPLGVDLTCVPGEFQRRVLEECARIPEGEVRTYRQLAAACGSPRAARAVGTAMATNPVPGLVPCHRVVRSDGRVGHYSAGGSEQKARMLRAEGVSVIGGRVSTKGEA